jgi:hypothetical protein
LALACCRSGLPAAPSNHARSADHLSGFEIVYAALESSAMIAGLLATADLGLALAGAYLIVAPTMEETE